MLLSLLPVCPVCEDKNPHNSPPKTQYHEFIFSRRPLFVDSGSGSSNLDPRSSNVEYGESVLERQRVKVKSIIKVEEEIKEIGQRRKRD